MTHIDTTCVQGGYQPGNGESRTPPIIQATTFKYTSSEQMSRLFDLSESGYFYTRLQNPTNDTVAAKICELEGGAAAMLTSSGQAANFFALFNICNAGDHIVASSAIYGGTFNLINVTMRKMGIECTFVSPDCTPEELDAAFRPNTKAVFGESISNPALIVLDFDKFTAAAHDHGVPTTRSPRRSTAARSTTASTSSRTRPPSTWTATAPAWAARSSTPVASTGWPTPTSSRD